MLADVLDAVQGMGPQGDHQHHGGRPEVARSARDVEELLRTEIGAEPCLGDGVVGELERHPRCRQGIAAMGDVGEGPAMDEDRHPFHRLDKVRVDGVLEQGGHGACPRCPGRRPVCADSRTR